MNSFPHDLPWWDTNKCEISKDHDLEQADYYKNMGGGTTPGSGELLWAIHLGQASLGKEDIKFFLRDGLSQKGKDKDTADLVAQNQRLFIKVECGIFRVREKEALVEWREHWRWEYRLD